MVLLFNTSNTVVFHDPQYPQLCAEQSLYKLVPGSFQLVDAAHLADHLRKECTFLISFHGPYFPKAAWQALLSFLERGGNLAIFGGMPFSRPIDETGEIEPEQDVYTRQVYLGPFFQVEAQAGKLELVGDDEATLLRDCPLTLPTEAAGTFWASYPKMTQADDHPEDLGSSGPLDTILQPLVYAQATTSTGSEKVATPAFLLDQRSGRFRGGRWLLSPWQPSSEESWLANTQAIQRLLLLAAEGPTVLDVHPALACYQPGEAPVLYIRARTQAVLHTRITVCEPDEETVLHTCEIRFPASSLQQEQSIHLPTLPRPGLYHIKAEYQVEDGQPLSTQNGFWIWDQALVEATHNQRLTAGRDYFYQNGRLFFVYGTTYMDSRVQRKFLHVPNPARWDHDLAEMKAAGVNLIRTGIWTAWRELIPLAGGPNEAFLRALDAFVMTFCKQNIQLIFTFFAFFPLLFEGENPWLDPRSLTAQEDLVALLARRYAQVELLSWDLINEPSFGDPQKIFAPRPLPHYDRFEAAAFQDWLKKRHTLSELQLRWRQTPADIPTWRDVHPPHEADFDTSVRNIAVRSTFQVADYTHFSQEMFCNWATRMVEAIRASGGQTLVGVGQDEAGARISPQYYAQAVDYTTTHPWWNIDDLLWDMLIDKTPYKPNLIQETGIMQLRDIDGRPWQSEQANAALLERKFTTALMARGAGIIQWLWHPNSYMDNDNENSIGLLRADRSAKPELTVMKEFGRLAQALDGQLLEASAPPDVWVVIPYSQWFARPAPARLGTQQAVRVLGYELGILPQMIGEHQLEALMTTPPRVVIVPAAQFLSQSAWQTLLHYVYAGGTLLVNGVLARDAYNFPCAPGLTTSTAHLRSLPISRYEELQDAEGQHYQLTFTDEKSSYVNKAHDQVYRYTHGAGIFVWCGLPLELASETAVIEAIYRQVLPSVTERPRTNAPLLITRRALRDGILILLVSESSCAQHITLDEGLEVTLEPNRAGALILKTDLTVQIFGGLH